MKTRILLLVGMCLGLAACESMDLVPKSQGNTESWYTTETELRLASNEFYILGYIKVVDGFHQPDTAHLKQVVQIFAPVCEPLDDAQNQPQVAVNELVAGGGTARVHGL